MARDFYAEAWRRGLDVKLGLAALVMQVFLMAPLSAAGAALMFLVLRHVLQSNRSAFWLSILYAFGTPIFFRTGHLNQNLITAHVAFAGFVALWNCNKHLPMKRCRSRFLSAGFAGGLCVLLDYSGVIFLALLWLYGLLKHREALIRNMLHYTAGALIPLALLWFYQWKSFGHPFYPPHYHMPAVNRWVETGFRGFVGPQPKLLWSLLFDTRYGLFLSCPLLLISPIAIAIRRFRLPRLELRFLFLFFLGLWIFFSGVNYTHLQFNTGIRYLVAIVPFLFIPTATVLMVLPKLLAPLLSFLSIVQSWCLAMYRDVERGLGIAEPLVRVFLGGLQLPILTTLSRMESLKEYFPHGPSPLSLFLLFGILIYFIWRKS
jgi:hypothetical protein